MLQVPSSQTTDPRHLVSELPTAHCLYTVFVERICIQCHAVLAAETGPEEESRVGVPGDRSSSQGWPDWCPACGGKLVERPTLPAPEDSSKTPLHAMATVDHRGIVLPPRHAVGGIITPQ